MEFKKSLQTDIQVGLLQSSPTMGDSKGTTYAAGHVSEADRLVVLEGFQKIVQNVANDAINIRFFTIFQVLQKCKPYPRKGKSYLRQSSGPLR